MRTYKRKTPEEFILAARAIHKDKYSYPSPYVLSKQKMEIECPTHGTFFQRPYSHLSGNGCHRCDVEQRAKQNTLTHVQFLKQAKKLHGNKYTYVSTYVHSQLPINITCPTHGTFAQTPCAHLRGHGCKHCRQSPKKPTHTKASGGHGVYSFAYFSKNPQEKKLPGHFYALKIEVQEQPLLKIGITKNLKKRLSDYSKVKGTPVLILSLPLYDAFLLEKETLALLAPFKYEGPPFSGHSECFTFVAEQHLQTLHETHHKSTTNVDDFLKTQ